MSLKILYLPAYFYPEKAASGYLSENRNQAFTEAGYEIEAYVPMPCRGISKEVREEYKGKRLEKLYDDKMTVHRFPMYSEGRNPIFRAIRYVLCWAIQLWKGMSVKKIDCVFLVSTPPIQGMMGAIIKKFRGKPFIYNLQDIFPDSLINNGLAKKNGLLWNIGRKIENFTYRHADKIIVISQDFKRNIMEKGVPEEKIEVIYNWVDQNCVVNINRDNNKLFDKYGLDRSKFYVTYNGNIGLSQNIEMLLNVAEEFQDTYKDIHFVLVGDGSYAEETKKIINDKKLKNIHMLPFQPYEDISHVFSLGDVSLVISKPGTGSASVPSKTWSIMSAQRPVLANFDENELKEIIDNNKCGYFTKAGDRESFKLSIIKLYQNRDMANQMGQNGRKFIMDNLTREVGVQKYVGVLNSVLKK